MGLELPVNHVNRNSRGNYQTELIYMCNYPPVIILSYLLPLSPPTSELKILCIKHFLPNLIQCILGIWCVCVKAALLLETTRGLPVAPWAQAVWVGSLAHSPRKPPSQVWCTSGDLEVAGGIPPGMLGDHESPERKPWLFIPWTPGRLGPRVA